MNYKNDHTMFVGEKAVAIKIKTAELHLFDRKTYGFIDRTLDEEKLREAGYEILEDL